MPLLSDVHKSRSPCENSWLTHNRARSEILQALKRAAKRGAKVRIYLDARQLAEREPANVFEDLAHTRGVEIRVKRENSALMHLNSYEIDGHLLRTGAANFSASGLKGQDNDLIVIRTSMNYIELPRNQ